MDSEWKRPFIVGSKVRAAVWEKTGGRCWYCGVQTIPWRNFCIDHVVDGIDDLENVVPCCRRCNGRKGKRGVEHLRAILADEDGRITYQFYFELLEAKSGR